MTNNQDNLEDLTLTTDKTRNHLNQRQLTDYELFREQFAKWMLNLGKNPGKAEGYAKQTTQQRLYRIDKFYRWLWNDQDAYTTDFSTDDCDRFIKEIAVENHSNTYKAALIKSLKCLIKYLNWEKNKDIDWEPVLNFSSDNTSSNPKDFLTEDERKKLRQAALKHGSIPHYTSLTPEKRDEWKQYLAQRFGKSKSDVTRADFKKANGWKEASVIWTSLDAGLRNIEVSRAKTYWIDFENGLLRIPKEESSKNEDYWTVSLRDRTVNILEKWIQERKQYEKYKDSEQLWLTRYGNEYSSKGVNRLLQRVLNDSDIERDVTWYSIRHSTGTYMAREEGLAAAQAQLRHKSQRTTMRYDQVPVEDRKDALDRMG